MFNYPSTKCYNPELYCLLAACIILRPFYQMVYLWNHFKDIWIIMDTYCEEVIFDCIIKLQCCFHCFSFPTSNWIWTFQTFFRESGASCSCRIWWVKLTSEKVSYSYCRVINILFQPKLWLKEDYTFCPVIFLPW